jgi:hypothetical protein
MGGGIEIADDVAAAVGAEDLALLEQSTRAGFECVACGRPGDLAAGPASVVLIRGEPFMVARVAHASCSPSRVVDVEPGTLRPAAEQSSTALAAVLPHASGARPVLAVEPNVHASIREGADRVDAIATGLMALGLHLVTSLGRSPGPAAGWRVDVRPRPVSSTPVTATCMRASSSYRWTGCRWSASACS